LPEGCQGNRRGFPWSGATRPANTRLGVGPMRPAMQAAFERGAAPITLIDGEKLLNLLRQHEIGVSKKAIEYFEFDPTKLGAVRGARGR
jgi:hypothetical protein